MYVTKERETGRPERGGRSSWPAPGRVLADVGPNAITGGRVDEAQVHAILALASAVNRLAVAAEAIAAAQA